MAITLRNCRPAEQVCKPVAANFTGANAAPSSPLEGDRANPTPTRFRQRWTPPHNKELLMAPEIILFRDSVEAFFYAGFRREGEDGDEGAERSVWASPA
jgi:hypothetical protein